MRRRKALKKFFFSASLYWLSGLAGLTGMGCRATSMGLSPTARGEVVVNSLRCEYLTDPIGIDTPAPRLSWVIQSNKRGVRQTAYQILASSSRQKLANQIGDLWNSGKISSQQSVQVVYGGKTLLSGQDCFWKVRVWDQNGRRSEWSEPARWSMGLLQPTDWTARWIQQRDPAPENATKAEQVQSIYPLPIFRKPFEIQSDVKSAKVYVCGLGHYELFVNGQKAGEHFLDPAWSLYEKTVYYNTFDITDFLRVGSNVFGVMLGKGFYNTRGDRRIHFVNIYRPLKLILQADIEYKDGSRQVVASDGSWKFTRGSLTHCAILGGSDYDARLLPADWRLPGYDEADWKQAEETAGPGGMLTAFTAAPMKRIAVFKPISVEEPQAGYFVYDFGQNASFTPRITLEGQAGQKVRFTPSEQRHGQTGLANDGKGRVNPARIGSPNYWEYTLRGGGRESWSPQFTYSGFQYIEASGAVPEGQPNPQNLPIIRELDAIQVRNASPKAGTFECSNPLFNQINELIDWAVQSNMAHVLTDCPHREKLGWLEESYLMGPSILWNYDTAALFTKKIRDIQDSQDPSGQIYTVAPNYPAFKDGFRYSPEWGAAGVFLPWLVYQWYGDVRILEQSYNMMKGYVDFMRDTSDELIAMPGLGDWFDYGHGESLGPSRFTPVTLTSTAIFYGCAEVVAKTALLLEKTKEAQAYAALCDAIRERFNKEFFDGRAVYQNQGSPQTANAMALALGLAPKQARPAVLEEILRDLKERNYQQTAGDVGFHYLVQTLSDFGRSDVLYRIANREELGSYGYIIKQGWTSLPEAWNIKLTSSMNHLMLGHIQQWFQQHLVGIRPDPAAAGFKKCIIKPEPAGDIVWCRGSHTCLYGTIQSAWKIEKNQFILDITIPANTSADVYIPAESQMEVAEGKSKAVHAKGVDFKRMEDGRAVFAVASGRYRFQSPVRKSAD